MMKFADRRLGTSQMDYSGSGRAAKYPNVHQPRKQKISLSHFSLYN
jgi:hypothetical protein